jgi:hypothetical protein
MPVLDQPNHWRAGTTDGTAATFPALPAADQADGTQVVYDGAGTAVLKMPARGFYFDSVDSPWQARPNSMDRCPACAN